MGKFKLADSLATVNDILIEQLMYVTNEDLDGQELDAALKRAKVVCDISGKSIELGKTVISAIKTQAEYGVSSDAIGIE